MIMSMSKMNKRYYCIELILYPDNKSHLILLQDLIKKYNYAYIYHDKDKNEDGTDKKPHFHLLIFFNNARWGTSILKEINIDNSNLIEFRENKVTAIQYLIHSNNFDKFQYDYSDIKSNINIDVYFNKFTNKESQDIAIIYDFINNTSGIIYYTTIYGYIINNNLWSSYRRNYSIIKDLINEHNSMIGGI